MHGICMDYACKMHGICMKYAFGVSVTKDHSVLGRQTGRQAGPKPCLGTKGMMGYSGCHVNLKMSVFELQDWAPRHTYGICMEYAWDVHGVSMDNAWNTFRICMACKEYTENMNGICVGYAIKMYGIFMEDAWNVE